MYYHFPKGKEELALESVKLAGEMIIKNLINQLDMFESPIDGIVDNFNDMAQIIQYFSWNMVFIILIPIPIIILIMILENVFLVNVGELTKPKIDYLSIILSSVGLGAIIFGISSVSAGDLKVSLISFIIGIILVAIFVSRQNKLKQPMLNLTPLKYPKFVIGLLLVMISMMVMFTMNVMLPMLLEESLGTTGFVAALALLPAVILNGAVTPVGGRIYDRYSVKWLVPIGILIMTVSVFVLANINIETSLGKIIVIYAVVCIGVGFTMSPTQTHSLNQLHK
ncbi:lincomycin resistance protein LmrB [Clostridium baratii]|uniref:Lincomycin resistance protein LmrB n=1 Tax=Clostridium baratii TaxID=1561 RepID=A0A174UE20_9CLOT|nr:lincomycin resistance protein LmrB [Clostridium baratii]